MFNIITKRRLWFRYPKVDQYTKIVEQGHGSAHILRTMASKESDVFSKVPELSQPNVFIKDKSNVNDKLNKIVVDGFNKLQFIADFDSTLTKSQVDGKATAHTLDIFARTDTLSLKYRDGCLALVQKYAHKVGSHDTSEEQKQELLHQWWLDHENLSIGETMTLEDIIRTTDMVNTPLRDGCKDVLSLLQQQQVPLTVVSAGLGEIIDYVLQEFKPVVVSNYMTLEDKKMLGFKKPTVSVYNKHLIPFPIQEGRSNIILLGDSLGDCYMADNVPNKETVLKIGFLTDQSDNQLEKYCDTYDIVVKNDQTMHLVLALLRLLGKNTTLEP